MKEPLVFWDEDNGGEPGEVSLLSQTSPEGTAPAAPAETRPPDNENAPAVLTDGWINRDGSFIPDWTQRLPEDVRGDAEGLKKFGNVNDLVRSYVNAERLIGKKGVFIPDEKSTPEQIAEFRKQLDVPEKPEEYAVKPENVPDGMQWNDDLAKPFLEIAHKHNVPKRAMKELTQKFQDMENARMRAGFEMAQAEARRKYEEGQRQLESAWGPSTPKQIELVQRAAAKYGTRPDTPGFSDPEIVKFVAKMAASISEDTFVTPNGAGSSMGPKERALDIIQNPENAEYKAYRSGHKPTQAKVQDLIEEAERLELRNQQR